MILFVAIFLAVGLLFLIIYVSIKYFGYENKKKHYKSLVKELRFLEVKIFKVERATEADSMIANRSLQQHIQVMNQLLSNFYAIYQDDKIFKKYGQNFVSCELFVEKQKIKFVLGIPKKYIETIAKIISGFFPGAIVNYIDQPQIFDEGKYMKGADIVLKKGSEYPIKIYESFEADPLDSIFSVCGKLAYDEKLSIQILLSPVDESLAKSMREKIDDIKEGKKKKKFSVKKILKKLFGKQEQEKDEKDKKNYTFSSQQLADFDKKADGELFKTKIRAVAISPDEKKAEKILEDLESSFAQYYYPGLNGFKFKKIGEKKIYTFAKNFIQRNPVSEYDFKLIKLLKKTKDTIFNVREISSIYHFPNFKFNKSPNLAWQRFKIVPAPDNIPQEGMFIGYNVYNGVKKEIRMKHMDRFRHVYIIGQTGTGKTTLMKLQIINDILNGNGVCYIDPHGDAVEEILQYIPKERIDDLIYFDLSNLDYPIGFNPLEAETQDEKDIVVNDLVEMFINMYGPEIFGPRIQDYFRNACFLLMDQPDGGSLVELVRLFADTAYAEAKIKYVKNPSVKSWWEKTYKAMGEREKKEIIPYFQAKFSQFTTGVYIRNVIGQVKSSFRFFDAMQEKKIILLNLSKGLVSEENSQLIGRMVAMWLKIAALKRAKIPQDERVPFFLYIDEFQNYVSKSIESILSEARKYRLGLVIAHQYIDQLKKSGLSGSIDLSSAVFGNVGTIFSLKVGAPDAEFLEKEFSPEFSKEDLINMDKFKGIMKMSIDFQASRPFTFQPLYYKQFFETRNTPEKVEIIKQISALKWGTPRELVEKEIYYRVGAVID